MHSKFVDASKFEAIVSSTSSSQIGHLDKTVSPRKADFLTMTHGAVTDANGATQGITEFNGGMSVSQISKQSSDS